MSRHAFPPPRELPWMCACYALTAFLGWMVLFPNDFRALVLRAIGA